MFMSRVCAAACVVALFGASEGVYAFPMISARMPVSAMLGHASREKTVHFGLRNGTSAPLKLRCGDELMTVDPGKVVQVKLPVGSKITFAAASGSHAAGDVLEEVSSTLDGTTLAVN